jgi:DNA-binding GntR family transcriptional regulator
MSMSGAIGRETNHDALVDPASGLQDIAFTRVKDDLIAGAYPPGSVLLETALAERYGVSRTPMREALGRLAQDGFIDRSSRGFRVRVRTPEEIMQIYETRILLESTVAGFAAERRTSLDLSRMEHLLEVRRESSDPSDFARLNDQWHKALRSASRNDVTHRLLELLDNLIRIYRIPLRNPSAADDSVEEHAAVLEAVRLGDAETARHAMTAHLVRMRDLRLESLATLGD